MSHRSGVLLLLGVLVCALSRAQDSVSAIQISTKYIDQVGAKAGKIEARLDKRTSKLLRKWQEREDRLIQKMAKGDSAKLAELLREKKWKFEQLKGQLTQGGTLQSYIPNLDTSLTSLKFLQSNNKLTSSLQADKNLAASLGKVEGMQQQFQKADLVEKFIVSRKQQWMERLQNLPFTKELKYLNKQVYYYRAQVDEYKSLLKDQKKAERKALALLSKTKLYKDFMRKNSQLTGLFRPPFDPTDPGSMANMAGLQTRAQVNGLIQQQLAIGGADAMAQVQQNMQEAKSKVNELKDRILKAGRESSDANIPDGFIPNTQKKKPFLRRIELGTNIQSQKANGYFPATTDIAVTAGYKFNDHFIIGIGTSYKLGLGNNIRHMHVTHQGLGARTFIDLQLKGSIWLSGGYEMNYRNVFRRIDQLKDKDAWQRTGLIGVSKVISVKTKLLKQTKLMLLWDFLSSKQAPKGQPIIFRTGYTF